MSEIRYSGSASMTDSGLEIMAFHLHRFLAGWMEAFAQDRLFITLGFEHAACEAATFCIELNQARVADVGWSFEDLCQTYRQGDGHLYLERADHEETLVLSTLPILDRPATGGEARVAMGFVLLPQDAVHEPEHLVALQTRVYEAVCAARRNAMRLFFDERRDMEVKALLYDFMAHLPEWTGCDYAASMVLTSSLETMTLDESSRAHFNVLAERVYASSAREAPQRLVGMMMRVDDGDSPHMLTAAFHRQREDADLPYQSFIKQEDGSWESQDSSKTHGNIHAIKTRQRDESMMVLTPLVARDGDERELMGFLCMTWCSSAELTSSAGDLLAEIGGHLGPLLRHSSLYMLSARKLWLLRTMRTVAERIVARPAHERGDEPVKDFIGEAAGLLREHVSVPSFGMAYMKHDDERGRVLRYEHPHGWSKNEAIDLWVDVPAARRTDSGVSSLAVRLNRPLVLAGGYGEGDDFGFKNSLFVHEESGRLEDVRRGKLSKEEGAEWVALSDYYKPAREHAYATLAYPVTFAGDVLGVLTIEVDKDTDWLWWTGFGGHLFWQLFASELASVFFALDVRARLS